MLWDTSPTMNFKVTPEVDFETEEVRLKLETSYKEMVTQVSREVLRTKEKAVRAGLIALGWTPPGEDKEEGR